jgi:hypothetical protein
LVHRDATEFQVEDEEAPPSCLPLEAGPVRLNVFVARAQMTQPVRTAEMLAGAVH